MGTGFSKKKKQARMLQDQLVEMQKDMVAKEVRGQAGNGLVEVVMTGENKIKSLKINPQCVDPEDIEGLEDLIKAAFTDAFQKLEANMPSDLSKMPGMPNIPGMPDLGSLLKGLGQ